MNLRTTLILAVLVLGLGAYAYFYEYKGGQKRDEQKEKEKVLFEIKKEDVSELSIDGMGKPVKIVAGKGDSWNLVEPVTAKADEATVNRILEHFASFKYRDLVDSQPKDLAKYGLNKPPFTVHIGLKGGKGEKVVQFGTKNPVENVTYTLLNNDPKVYTTEDTANDLSAMTMMDLRDKKLTDFSTDKVETVSIHEPNQDLEFHKDSGTWRMTKPIQSPASESDVTSLLSSLESLRAVSFPPASGAVEELQGFGLTNPVIVRVILEKGLEQTVHFGKKDNDKIFVSVEGSNTIASVGDSFTTFFNKKVEDWREKKLVAFNPYDAEEVRIHAQGKDYVLKKGKEEKWAMESPTKSDVDTEKVQSLLSKLESAQITRYGTESSISGPSQLEFSAQCKDWQDHITKKHLVFGPVKDNLQQVKNDDYSTIVLLNGALQSEIEKAAADLVPKPQSQPQTAKK